MRSTFYIPIRYWSNYVAWCI